MPKIMNLPKIGVNMTEAIITEWIVKEGDTIKEGDLILNAETDKATQDIFSTDAGVIAKILVQAGERAVCQEPIAILVEPGEKLDESFQTEGSEAPKQEDVKPADKKADDMPTEVMIEMNITSNQGGRVKVSPLAKRIAKDMGIDYKQVLPSMPHGRIIRADVLAFAQKVKQNAN